MNPISSSLDSVGFLLYYPAKRLSFGDFSIPWFCAHGISAPFCIETLTSRSLTDEVDLGRVFGSVSSESCDDVTDVTTDSSSPEGSGGGSHFASSTMYAAPPALVASFMIGLLW